MIRTAVRIVVAAMAAAAAALLVLGLTGSEPPAKPAPRPKPPPPAQVFVAPGGLDSAPCTRAKPCRTFSRAYARAKAGQIVEIAAGTYPGQSIDAPGKTGAAVRFRVARGAKVQTGQLDIFAGPVAIDGPLHAAGGWYVKPGADRVTLRRIDADGWYAIRGASNVKIVGGDLGPGLNLTPQVTDSRNVTFDGVRFHDWTRDDDEAHVDCLGIFGGNERLTVRNSRFSNCEAFNILIDQSVSDAPNRDVVIENNFLSCCRSGYYSVYIAHNDGAVRVSFNSSNKDMGLDTENAGSGPFLFDSNVIPSMTRNSRVMCALATWRHNVIAHGPGCHSSDRVGDPRFKAPDQGDFHLESGSAAIGAGNPEATRRRDIDGGKANGRPDAGADEFRSAR